MTKLQLFENINTFKQSVLHSGDNKHCSECWNLKKIFLSGAMHLAGFPVTKWVISNKKWLIAPGMRFYFIPSKWRSGAESSTHVTNTEVRKEWNVRHHRFPHVDLQPPGKTDLWRQKTEEGSPGRESKVGDLWGFGRGLPPAAEEGRPQRWWPEELHRTGAWKRRGAGFLWLFSWDWTHWRDRLFSCAGGEKKLPLDLVGAMPLSSRGCLLPSHLLSNGLASRWPGNYALLESRARDHKVVDSWSCGPRAGGAGRLVLLAPSAPCMNFAPHPPPRPGPTFSPASGAANLQNAGQSKPGLGAPRRCSSRKAEEGWGLGRGRVRGYQNPSEVRAAMTLLGCRGTPKAGSLL